MRNSLIVRHLIFVRHEISSNLDKPLIYIRTPLLTQPIELLSSLIASGTGLQSSRLVQGKGSNPFKVLIKEK